MTGRILPKFITEKGFCKYSMNFLARPALKRTSKSDELEIVKAANLNIK
jgi:hypothetical protein